MNIRFFGIAAIFALALTACPGTTTPTVSSVTVTAPSSNALKINEAVQFNAVAKDSGSAEIPSKTFTWVSSDPNVATVDTNGMVTAKRFGTIKITASVEGKSGESASQTTFGLEAIGGTRTTLGNTSTQVAFLARFRKADGSGPVGAGVLTLKGPTGWNNNQPDTTNYTGYDKFVWWRSGIGSTNAITGTYSLETTVDGTIFNSSFQIDATKTIESPSSITPSDVTTTSISASWSAITGANSYVLEVWNDTDKKNAFNQWNYVGNTTATVTGTALDPAKTYFVQVHSFNTNLAGGPSSAAFTGTLPEQFNVGFYRVKLGAFANPAATGTVNGYSIDSSLPTKPAKLNVSGVDSSGGVIKTGSIANPSVSLASIKVSSRDVVQVRASSYVPTDVTASVCGQVTGQTGATAAAIALDSTGSMSTTDPPSTPGDFTTTKRNLAAKLYLDRMGTSDVTAISSFDYGTIPTSPYLAIKLWQTFSSDTTLLKTAIDSATFANTGTNLWDAVFDSTDLVATRLETNKVAVVLTDGEDNSSIKTPTQTISNANNKYVKVFLVGLSSAAAPLSATALTNMQSIASGTGGVFALASDATALSSVFNGIFNATQGSACVSLVFTPLPPVNTLIQGTLGFSMNGGAVTAPFTVQY